MNFEEITAKENKERLEHRLKEEDLKTPRMSRDNLGTRYTKENKKWLTVDNTTGDFFMEEFNTKQEALQYLKDLFL